ncbi:unnamed protein product [Ectocarpus sp. 12 AP-2014]
MICALLEGGANVISPDNYGQTPLHISSMWSSVAAVELLLRWGADEKLKNDDGDTPPDVIGVWEDNGNNDAGFDFENQRIRRMLAHPPADRSWGRCGWLVLRCSCPTGAQIGNCSSSGSCAGSSKGFSSKAARVSGRNSSWDDEEIEDDVMVDWTDLVGRLVGLEADGLFRLVVGFL